MIRIRMVKIEKIRQRQRENVIKIDKDGRNQIKTERKQMDIENHIGRENQERELDRDRETQIKTEKR